MKDAARFALAIAAILSATALDAQQTRVRSANHETEASPLTVRSRQPDDAPPVSSPAVLDGFLSASGAGARVALTDEPDHPQP